MSQVNTRLHIRVASYDVWKRFKKQDLSEYGIEDLSEIDADSYVIDESSFYDIEDIVRIISKVLGKDGIVIADLTDLNIDPFTECCFYLGERVRKTSLFYFYLGKRVRKASFSEGYSKPDLGCMAYEADIENIDKWLNYAKFQTSEQEQQVMAACGIVEINGNYKEIKKNITDLPSIAYLRETSMNNRAEVIEKSLIGEEVYFVEAADEYDPFRLEVFSELGSLGYLDSYTGETIMPLMKSKRLDYTARIAELVKPSERNKHAKSSIVGISIDAKICGNPVPPKTSVPHIER